MTEEPNVRVPEGKENALIALADKVKRVIAGVLLVLMFGLLMIAVAELVWIPLTMVFPGLPGGAEHVLLTEAQLLGAFGVFLSVLIALELVETVEVYFRDNEVHAEIVLLVAMIAIARKVVLIDLHDYQPMTIIGLATLFVGLAAAYVAIRWSKTLGPVRNDGQ
jgi:uncharacterized membrane protein (DUF373 family)